MATNLEYFRKWRQKNREKYNAYQREWQRQHPRVHPKSDESKRKRNEKRRLLRSVGLYSTSKYSIAWKARNVEKVRAHAMIGRAIDAGTLVRPPHCESCGLQCKPHAHHRNYSEPLSVRWLCALCHKREHEPKPNLAGKELLAT